MRITVDMIVRREKRKNYRMHDTHSDYQSCEIVWQILKNHHYEKYVGIFPYRLANQILYFHDELMESE